MIRRSFSFDVRAEDSQSDVIQGYAAVFDKPSLDLGGFTERIAQGAFTNTLADSTNDVLALWAHDWSMPLGRRSAGTLKLIQDEVGLSVEITPNDTTWSRDAVASLKAGNVRGMSFGFVVDAESWDYETKTRTIDAITLYEVSLVANPAYPDTAVSVRSLIDELDASFHTNRPSESFLNVTSRQLHILKLKHKAL
jgi:HK97 family phage prohead protease